ncbi:MAG: hypothetical protein ACK4TL_10735 [Hyphomicrobiaceae bacterium]
MARMRALDIALKLLGLADVICAWQEKLARLDKAKRAKVAAYAEAVAGSLARMATALERLESDAADRVARRSALREIGRLAGYVETIVATLRGHVDGRRLAGVARRLQALSDAAGVADALARAEPRRIEPIIAAEGYMRALADSLRT